MSAGPPRARDRYWVGLDVGGSAIKYGAVDAHGERLLEDRLELDLTRAPRDAEALLASLVERARDTVDGRLAGVGIGLPGLLDRAAGCIRESPNLAWLSDRPLAAPLARNLGLPSEAVVLENDANAAALGELWLGAGRGERHFLLLTLGTGIGGGLILDGELFLGEGLAGEVGHVSIDEAGPLCNCGAHGCLETFASGRAAERRARERGLPASDPGNLEALVQRARAEAGPERTLLEEIGHDLGRGLSGPLMLLDLRGFVLGGGFGAALDMLEPGVRRGLEEHSYGGRTTGVRLLRAALGGSAGWIGAARRSMLQDPGDVPHA